MLFYLVYQTENTRNNGHNFGGGGGGEGWVGVRGPGEKPYWGETRSRSSGGSQPEQKS